MSSTPHTSGTFSGQYDSTSVIVIVCCALAAYNAVELTILVFTTFNVYRGLYFWSLLVSTFGVFTYVLGWIVYYFRLTSSVAGLVLNNYGWVTMVVGQSVVLYSRLGIVLGRGSENLLKVVKWMIIIGSSIFYVPSTVTVFGSYYASDPHPYTLAYNGLEKFQMTGFCVLEFFISGLYMWKTLDILKKSEGSKQSVRKLVWQLFAINVIIVLFDIALLVIEYKNLHIPEVVFKGLAYSVKLKLEFAVLSTLVEFSSLRNRQLTNALADTADFLSEKRGSDASTSGARRGSSPWLTRPNWVDDTKSANAVQRGSGKAGGSAQQIEMRQSSITHCPELPAKSLDPEKIADLMYADAIRGIAKPQ